MVNKSSTYSAKKYKLKENKMRRVTSKNEVESMEKNFKSLDLNILKNKKRKIVSLEEGLKDVVPFEWSEEVMAGKKKITVGYDN